MGGLTFEGTADPQDPRRTVRDGLRPSRIRGGRNKEPSEHGHKKNEDAHVPDFTTGRFHRLKGLVAWASDAGMKPDGRRANGGSMPVRQPEFQRVPV